jgi:acetyl esterase/lipase
LYDLPDCLILTGKYDPLRSDAETFAEQLERANVNVTFRKYNSVHVFFLFYFLEEAQAANKYIVRILKERV